MYSGIITLLSNNVASNHETILDTFEKQLTLIINNGSEREASIAIQLCHYLPLLSKSSSEITEISKDWQRVRDNVFAKCADRLTPLYTKHFEICYYGFKEGKVTITQILKWYKVKRLFTAPKPFVHTLPQMSIINELVIRLLVEDKIEFNQLLFQLEEISYVLTETPVPWIDSSVSKYDLITFKHDFDNLQASTGTQSKIANLLDSDTAKAAFVVIIIFAVAIEVWPIEDGIDLFVKTSHGPLSDLINKIIQGRLGQVPRDIIQNDIDKIDFLPKQKELLNRWVRSEVNFTKKGKVSRKEVEFFDYARGDSLLFDTSE